MAAAPPPLRAHGSSMLDTLAVVLVILWLLGVVSSFTAGGAIHLLLIVAVAIFLVRMLAGRRK